MLTEQGVKWMNVIQGAVQWQALVNSAMTIHSHKTWKFLGDHVKYRLLKNYLVVMLQSTILPLFTSFTFIILFFWLH